MNRNQEEMDDKEAVEALKSKDMIGQRIRYLKAYKGICEAKVRDYKGLIPPSDRFIAEFDR